MHFMLRNAILITLLCICTKGFSQSGIISTYSGNGLAGYMGDGGAATSARMYHPGPMAIDGAGNMYIADIANNAIRKITPAGIISTVAGTGVAGYSGDGGLATSAQLNNPYEVCFDAAGNMYISDHSNHRIRKVNTSGIISTIAGTGTAGYSGDGGTATSAMMYNPAFMYVDGPGNVYFCDNQNHRIRKIDAATGFITTIAGTGVGGYSGDGGPATSAQILFPNGIFIDAGGIIYISDATNNRIRKINTSGIISTIAGTGTAGYSGDGGPATSAMLNIPQGIYIDAAGNIFFTDTWNHRVRKINTAGIISTVAGTGTAGFSGDGGLATSAKLNTPDGVIIDPSGKMYIADQYNNRIRVINIDNVPFFTSGASATLSICASSTAASTNSLLAVTDLDAGQTLTWSVLAAPSHGTAAAAYTATSTGGTVTPTGLSYTPTAGYSGTDLFSVIVSDGAAADTITIVVNIAPLPDAGIITGSAGICVGSSATLSDASPGGAWTSGNTSVATIMTSGVTTGISAGTAAITYTATNSCGTAYATKTVTINPLPAVSTISGSLNLCMGSTSLLTDATPSGTWSSANPSVASISSSGLVTPVATGTATISYVVTNAFGCTSAVVAVVTVNTQPAGTVVPSGTVTICPSGSATLSVISGIGNSYQWSMGVTPIPGATNSNYTTSTSGSYNVTVTNTIGCSTTLAGATVVVSSAATVVPSLSITAAPGTILCSAGSPASFTATPTNGGSAPAYQWYVNSIPMGPGTSSYAYIPSNGDTVKCRLTSSNTCALPTTATSYVVMTISAPVTPAVSIAAAPNDTVCSGEGINYLPTITYGGTAPTYLWIRNGVNVATGPTYFNPSPVDGDIVVCKITSNHVCATPSVVSSAPLITHVLPHGTNTLTVTASATNISAGSSVTFSAVSPYATSFQWYINGTPVSGATNAVFVTTSLANGNIVNCAAHSDNMCVFPATIISGGLSMHVTAGVNDFSATSFNIFPNPSKGYITVGGDAQNTVAIEIADILGHVIYTSSAIPVDGKVNHHIDLNKNFSNGHYFVRVTSENEATVFQVVLDR